METKELGGVLYEKEQVKQAKPKENIKNLASLVLRNLLAFGGRTVIGITAGIIGNKIGIDKIDRDLIGDPTLIEYLVAGIASEACFDLLDWSAKIPGFLATEPYPRLSKERLKENLKDDVGSIAGLTLGLAIGNYIANHYL